MAASRLCRSINQEGLRLVPAGDSESRPGRPAGRPEGYRRPATGSPAQSGPLPVRAEPVSPHAPGGLPVQAAAPTRHQSSLPPTTKHRAAQLPAHAAVHAHASTTRIHLLMWCIIQVWYLSQSWGYRILLFGVYPRPVQVPQRRRSLPVAGARSLSARTLGPAGRITATAA